MPNLVKSNAILMFGILVPLSLLQEKWNFKHLIFEESNFKNFTLKTNKASKEMVNHTNQSLEDSLWCLQYNFEIYKTEVVRWNLIISCCVAILLSCLIVAANGLLLMLVSAKKSARSKMNTLYIMLSISDLLSGLTYIPVYIYFLIGFCKNSPYCFLVPIWSVLGYANTTMSISAIACITMEVYLAVINPIAHKTRVNKKIFPKILIAIWLVCIISPFVIKFAFPKVWLTYRAFITIYGFTILVSLIICQYRVNAYLHKNQGSSSEHRNKKAIRVALEVLLVYGMTSVPSIAFNIINTLKHSPANHSYWETWVVIIAGCNALLDTFIYGFRTNQLKREARVFVFRE
ncbi:lysophosphatidic acid receptor 6-like [Hydractinia symbiolongicarpus]|uniref:lysophosphatidic acid receptor 6-like n=1 Tax=Hydractinia symbiolongicarpus TaxID=13093 RepID=UPI00254BCC44|nr:lysophosphatidic acid receptor 6-like [Hydractinia symbiolongicarpus]